jgi:DNA replication protein DnaC
MRFAEPFELNQNKHNCDLCVSGFVLKPLEYLGKTISISVPCICRKQKACEKLLAAIPPEFRNANLENLVANSEIHSKQMEAIELIKANPDGSYVITGRYGSGKTHLFYALYRYAVERAKKVFGGTFRGLLDEYQKEIILSKAGERYSPPITAEDYKQSEYKCALFLDDIDKARATEYAAEKLFEILDAVYSNHHQFVVTTNLRVEELLRHFEKADEFGRYGGSIIRRLLQRATEIEMF